MKFNIPVQVSEALKILSSNGFEGWIVGGCVRDFLMGREPADFDITTSATPSETIEAFRGYRIIETGLKHGTVTVIVGGMSLEITTFRIDGEYFDGRHPSEVKYTRNLKDDLSRRDFTMNAIAYNEELGLYDIFGGQKDIENKKIVCVGEAEKRFSEDALRIMRAIRFSSQIGFEIEEKTAEQVHRLKHTLNKISAERIRVELDKLLCGQFPHKVLMEYSDVITEVIPELKACIGFDQKSPYHKYTVWEHSAYAVQYAVNEQIIRLTMLFHDIAKPATFKTDENGRGHFKTHAPVGAEMTKPILKRLKYDNKTIDLAVLLIKHHSDKLKSEKAVKRLVAEIGAENFYLLMEVYKADASSKQDFCLAEKDEAEEIAEYVRKLEAEKACLSLSALEVNGNDMISIGLKGREIGNTLKQLLDDVICRNVQNNHSDLMKLAEKYKKDSL